MVSSRRWPAVLALGVVVVGLAARVALLARDLPYYAIDENDVVEPALAVVCGDWNPLWYGYGPAPSYLLAGFFALWRLVAATFAGQTEREFFYAAFFEPTSFYVMARLLHLAAAVSTGVLIGRLAWRSYGPPAGVAGLILGLVPLQDANAAFFFRTDTLLGFVSLAALGVAGQLVAQPGFWRAAGAGGLAGLGLSVKPLQGLLPLPVLTAGVLWAAWRSRAPRGGSRVPLLGPLWGFLLGVVAGHALSNPFGVLHLTAYLRENIDRVRQGVPTTQAGWEFGWLVDLAGPPLVLGLAVALVAAASDRKPLTRVLLAYVVLVALFYATREVRPYWYNAVLPAALVLLARGVGRLAERMAPDDAAGAQRNTVLLATLLALSPTLHVAQDAKAAWWPTPSLERRADRAAQRWIERSVPAGSRLLMIGLYALNLPRVVAETPRVHGDWAEVFMYRRDQQRCLVDRFKAAYRQHRRSGAPLYWIEKVRRLYSGSLGSERARRALDRDVGALARASGQRYVVTASPDEFQGSWEGEPGVRLLARFGRRDGYLGDEVKIFEVAP